jgi:type III pantothenate kinase
MPGVGTAAAVLTERTAKLPAIPLAFPSSAIGKSTQASMQSGVLYGAVDAVDGMVRRFKKQVGRGCKVVATGGYGRLVAGKSATIDLYNQDLVLLGAYVLYRRGMAPGQDRS